MSEEQRQSLEEPESVTEHGEPTPEESAAEEEAPDTSGDGEDPAAEPQPKAKGVQKRIDELTANWRNTERDRDEWRQLAQQLMAQQGKPKEEAPEPPQEQPKPQIDQFSDYDQYLEALADWKADQRVQSHLSEFERRRQQEQEQQTHQQKVQSFRERAQEFAQEHPDFDAVVNNPSVPISQPVADSIVESDMGPQVAYHLGQNPDKARELSQMSATAAAREVGKLEAQLSVPQKPKVSQAPDPVDPVGGGSEKNAKDPEKMTTAEWMVWRQKQVSGQ